MTSEGGDISCVERNLTSLGLGNLSENTDSFSGLLDQLIKVTECVLMRLESYKRYKYKNNGNTQDDQGMQIRENTERRAFWIIDNIER
jgi:hypothetical protein